MSKRERVLNALYLKLKSLEDDSIKVYRNLDKPQKITPGGMIILRDGDGSEPEILLSPLTYIYEHMVTIEVLMQHTYSFDSLLASIGGVINNNRTLDGLAEWVEAKAPDFTEEPIEGAATIRIATIEVMVRFFTYDPLN